jgi:hypothetical protein
MICIVSQGHVADGQTSKAYRIIGLSIEKQQYSRLRCTQEDNIKLDLKESDYGDADCIKLTQNRFK